MRIILLASWVVLNLALVSVPVLARDSAKPNIVFIMADDLGGRDLPVYGNRFNEAPYIDRSIGRAGDRISKCLCGAGLFGHAGEYPVRSIPG